MKRITILGNQQPSGPTWDVQLSKAVAAGDHAKLVKLISQADGKRKLREGFQSGSTFAMLCLKTGAIDALRAVLAAAPNGISLNDTCVHHVIHHSGGRKVALEIYSDMQLHEEAVGGDYPSSEALALALEFEPNHPCLTQHLDRFDGATLHYQSLSNAAMLPDSPKAAKYADCCRLLLSRGAPIGHRVMSTTLSMTDMMFVFPWHRNGNRPNIMADLIADYVRAGWVDIDAKLGSGRTPVESAILHSNGHAAAAAIDIGCALATPSFPKFGDDLVALARNFAVVDQTGECASLVTAAVMRRKLRELTADRQEPAGQPSRRRAARVGI